MFAWPGGGLIPEVPHLQPPRPGGPWPPPGSQPVEGAQQGRQSTWSRRGCLVGTPVIMLSPDRWTDPVGTEAGLALGTLAEQRRAGDADRPCWRSRQQGTAGPERPHRARVNAFSPSGRNHCPWFVQEEETEARGGYRTCPRPHSPKCKGRDESQAPSRVTARMCPVCRLGTSGCMQSPCRFPGHVVAL